ncbi:MAG: alpha/beta hydrolase [Ignavibacteriales bacterium]|nr:alpha/beta hydrolase [Ignavibacteriales bacterium]
MPAAEINGTKLEYLEAGNGEPVIFVHGSVSDYRTWKAQVDFFSQKYRVFAYSRRYHFPNSSAGNGSDYTVDTHSRDLVEFIRKVGLRGVRLVGSSYGAYTSLITGIRNPDLIRILVLGEPPVLPLLAENPDNPLHMVSLVLRSPITALRFMRFGMTAIKPAQEALRRDDLEGGLKLFINGVLGEGSFDRLPPPARTVFVDNAKALKAELLGPGFPPFPIEEARTCRIPILFVYGEKSPRFFHAISDKLLKILPNAQRVFITGASHGMHRDNPEEYNSKVLSFLSDSHG